MWSEHCSYKSSRLHLRRLPTEGPRVLVGPGENAGVIDAGDGIAVAIRIESHNHPSAIEPYQGAATGVGGILRDIFTMGARPLAVMDPLFFGPPDDARQRWLVEGVVSGISGYGNSVGVPTVGGELTFDPCYAQNPLVNVLCMGALPTERLVLGIASGPGNLAVLLGSSTGRDGIGGRQRARLGRLQRRRVGAADDTKRPSVQVGDPFEEKRLIEACLELLDTKLVVGIQDLGGAGLACATSETAGAWRRRHGRRRLGGAPARGGHGALGGDDEREPGAHAGHRHTRVVAGGGGHLRQVGGAGDGHRHGDAPDPDGGGRLRIRDGLRRPRAGRRAGGVAVRRRAALRPPAPGARRPGRPRRPRRRPTAPATSSPCCARRAGSTASTTTSSSSTRWRARAPTPRCSAWPGPGCPRSARGVAADDRLQPAGLRARPAGAAPRSSWPRRVANLACVGATPAAVVNCLNFGNPEHPEVMWQLSECIDGMAEACRALSLPVIGGQRQPLQRERRGRHRPDAGARACSGWSTPCTRRRPGWRWGDRRRGRPARRPRRGGRVASRSTATRWATERRGPPRRAGPRRRLRRARGACAPSSPRWWPRRSPGLPATPLVHAVHDVSGGGLAVALAEMAAAAGVGCSARRDRRRPSSSPSCPSRFVVATAEPDELCARAAGRGIPAAVLGRAGGDRLVLGGLVDLPVDAVREAYEGNLALALGDS